MDILNYNGSYFVLGKNLDFFRKIWFLQSLNWNLYIFLICFFSLFLFSVSPLIAHLPLIYAYQSSFLPLPPLSSLLLPPPPPPLHTFTSPPLLYLATYSILLQTPNIWTPNTGFKRPNCALDKRTILCLYFPAGFQRQVFKHVKI